MLHTLSTTSYFYHCEYSVSNRGKNIRDWFWRDFMGIIGEFCGTSLLRFVWILHWNSNAHRLYQLIWVYLGLTQLEPQPRSRRRSQNYTERPSGIINNYTINFSVGVVLLSCDAVWTPPCPEDRDTMLSETIISTSESISTSSRQQPRTSQLTCVLPCTINTCLYACYAYYTSLT
jgi:hypothetical protein